MEIMLFFIFIYVCVFFLVFFSLPIFRSIKHVVYSFVYFMFMVSKNKYVKIVIYIILIAFVFLLIFNFFYYSWIETVIKLSNIESIRVELDSRILNNGDSLSYESPPTPKQKESFFLKVAKRAGFFDLFKILTLQLKKYNTSKKSKEK